MAAPCAESALFQLGYKILMPMYTRLFNWSCEGNEIHVNIAIDHRLGEENIPKEGRILYVGYHSIHSLDLFPMAGSIYKATGELPRGLVHSAAMVVYGPLMRRLGCVAGSQENGIQAYKDGYNCICMPGGIEESMQGFESAYKLIWKSSSGRPRNGFAKLARQVDATIVPFVTRNGEEMYFSIIGYLWNVLGLSRLYEHLLDLPEPFRCIFLHVKMLMYFFAWTLLSIPVPVRAGVVFGKSIVPDRNESEVALAMRTKSEMQDLIERVNPGGHSYMRGLQDRLESK